MTFLNLGTFFTAFLVSVGVVHFSIRLAKRWALFDVAEGDALKIHKGKIPYLGGVALVAGVGAAAFFSGGWGLETSKTLGLFAAALFVFVLGFWDDVTWKHISRVRPYRKFVLLLLVPLAASILLFWGGARFGADEFLLAVPLTALYIFVFVNAVNYQDGMDGLAGTLSALSCGGFAMIGFVTGNSLVLGFSLALLGAIGGFLVFNVPPAKVFMGDSGAYFLGFSLAFLVLFVSDFHAIEGTLGPVFLFGVPLFEGLYTNARRLILGKSIFRGDRSHTYDVLLQRGYSAKKVLALFSFIQLASVVLGAWLMV